MYEYEKEKKESEENKSGHLHVKDEKTNASSGQFNQ